LTSVSNIVRSHSQPAVKRNAHSGSPLQEDVAGNEFVIRAALPGLAADDVTVEIGKIRALASS